MITYPIILPQDRIAGGIRTAYRHVEALNRHGLEAVIANPYGRPTWFRSDAPVIAEGELRARATDHVVFPEAFQSGDALIDQFLRSRARKHCFCQNHFNLFLAAAAERSLPDRGVRDFFSCSPVISRFVEAVLGLPEVPVVPCVVDRTLFRPADKTVAIAFMPRKLPKIATLIRRALAERHPDLRTVPWWPIEGRSEEQAAEILGRAAVFLSLSHQEGLGLPPLEAMACGCLVVGFHGGGGREYVTACNGLWFEPDQILECVDGLATAVRGAASGAGFVQDMRRHGDITAAAYTPERMEAALLAYFRGP